MSTALPADDLRFDIYAVVPEQKGGMGIIEYMLNIPLLAARILHGQSEEFDREVEGHGWAGSCPTWNHSRPIVVMPHGELLDMDHIGFMATHLIDS